MSFWAWVLDPRLAAVLTVFGALMGQILAAFTVRRGFDWRLVGPFVAGGTVWAAAWFGVAAAPGCSPISRRRGRVAGPLVPIDVVIGAPAASGFRWALGRRGGRRLRRLHGTAGRIYECDPDALVHAPRSWARRSTCGDSELQPRDAGHDNDLLPGRRHRHPADAAADGGRRTGGGVSGIGGNEGLCRYQPTLRATAAQRGA